MGMNNFGSIKTTESVLDVLSTTEYAAMSASDRTDILEWLLEATMMLPSSLAIIRDLCNEMFVLQEQLENVSIANRNTRSTFDQQLRLKMLETKLRMKSPCCRLDRPGVRYHLLPAKLVLGPEKTRQYQAYAQVITSHCTSWMHARNYAMHKSRITIFAFSSSSIPLPPPICVSRTWDVASTRQIALSEATGLLLRNNSCSYSWSTAKAPVTVGFLLKLWAIWPSYTDI